MNVLIVENSDIKFRMLERWLSEAIPECSIDHAKSYQSGLKAIETGYHDWIFLDMTLPVFDEKGGILVREQLTFGGRLILEEMFLNNITRNVIVVTQYRTFARDGIQVTFEELREELIEEFSDCLRECVVIRGLDQTWMEKIEHCIKAQDL